MTKESDRSLSVDAIQPASEPSEIAELRKEAARYWWLRPRISGAEYRRLGLVYSEGADVSARIDAAIADAAHPPAQPTSDPIAEPDGELIGALRGTHGPSVDAAAIGSLVGAKRMSNGPCENTDREIWRERDGDFYADSIYVTERGSIGINCGGKVFVMKLRDWHDLASGAIIPAPIAQPQVEPYDDPRELLRGAMGYMDVSDTESRDLWGRIKDYLAGPVAQTQEWASEPDIEALITLLLDNRLSLNQKNLIASMLRQLAVQPASEPTNE